MATGKKEKKTNKETNEGSTWKVSSLMRRSDLRRFFWASAWRRCSPSSSCSSSRTRCSSLTMAFLPPLRALASDSSRRF